MRRVLIATSLILLALGVLVIWWWNGPVRTVPSHQPTDRTTVEGAETKLDVYESTYFKTALPSAFRVKTSNEMPDGPIFGQYLVTYKSQKGDARAGITIGSAGSDRLDDISLVLLRSRDTSYHSSSRTFAPKGSLVFEKDDNTEVAVFWIHDSRYAAAVVSGTADQASTLEELLSTIITNWQWK